MYRLLDDDEAVKPDDEILILEKTGITWGKPELSMIGYPARYCHSVRRCIDKQVERLKAVQIIVSLPCDAETANCAWEELDDIIDDLTGVMYGFIKR